MTSSPEYTEPTAAAPGHHKPPPRPGPAPARCGLGRRTLGSGGPAVTAIGLGCMGMAGSYGPADDAESIRTLRRALELGCGFWDTSDAYGPHTGERLLARVLRSRREQIFVATKFGVTIDPRTLRRSVDGSPANARRSCDASLGRLGVEHIDLYYPHRVDPSTPIEETVGAMADLVREGKVRYIDDAAVARSGRGADAPCYAAAASFLAVYRHCGLGCRDACGACRAFLRW